MINVRTRTTAASRCCITALYFFTEYTCKDPNKVSIKLLNEKRLMKTTTQKTIVPLVLNQF